MIFVILYFEIKFFVNIILISGWFMVFVVDIRYFDI